MKRILYLAVLLAFLAPCAWADGGHDIEVTVHSGWSFIDVEKRDPICLVCEFPFFENTTTVNNSPLFGFKAGVYLSSHAEVEGRFSVSPNHNVITDNSFICPPGQICPLRDLYFPFYHLERNMVAYNYGGNFIYNFTTSDVRPFVTFGVGGVSSDVDQFTSHDFALQYGGGAKFYFGRAGLRLEVVDQLIPNYFLTSKTQHDVQVQYGIVIRLH